MSNNDRVVNLYGDDLSWRAKRRGANISSQRMDDLDSRCIEYAFFLRRKRRNNFRSVDLGCGDGVQSFLLALLGYEAFAYDQEPLPHDVLSAKATYGRMRFKFRQCDLADLNTVKFPNNGVDICYSQRFIHYLHPTEARQLLEKVTKSMTRGGHLFISASGKNTEIGRAHPFRDLPLNKRFASIESTTAKKHSIHDPITVYSLGEFEEMMNLCGFETVDVWESDFGNLKGVFAKE